MFLLDSSDATQNDFTAMLNFVKRAVDKLSVAQDKDQISVVQYSSEPAVAFLLNTHKTKQDVADNLGILRHRGGRLRNTGAALQYVTDNIFTASSGSRNEQGVPQILILVTGGRSSDDVIDAAENLKRSGVMVFVVGIRNHDPVEAQSISQDATYAFFTTDTAGLFDIQQQIDSAITKGGIPVTRPTVDGKNALTTKIPAFQPHNSVRIMSKARTLT